MLDDALDTGVAAVVDVEFGIGVEVVEQILLAVRSRFVGDELDVLEVGVEVRQLVVVGRDRDAAFVVGVVGLLGQPLDEDHGRFLVGGGGVLVDAVRVVRSGGSVLLALDGDRERHVADVLGVVACGLDLGDRPGAEHHGGDVAAVQLVLGSFPIGGGVIVLGQAIGHGVIQDLVDVVGVGAVTRILERVLGVGEDVVHVVGIAGGRAADVRVPGAHGPTSRVVGVQRSGLGLLLDGLQVGDEFLRGGRQLVDAGLLEDPLVVDDAGGVADRSHAVDLLLVGLVDSVLDLLVHVSEGAVGDEVVLQFGPVDRRNHHDVAPVTALKTKMYYYVRIGLVEFGDVLLPGRSRIVVLEHIGTMAEQLQIGLDVLAGLTKLDVLVLYVGDLGGATAAATAGRHAHRADSRDAGCDDLLEIHLPILPCESLSITSGVSAPMLHW